MDPTRLSRREFLRYSACGLSAIALGGCGFGGAGGGGGGGGTPVQVDLRMTDALVEMVDKTPVYHWVFASAAGARFPGPVVFAFAGSPVTFTVTNALDEVHEFRVVGAGPGGGNADTGPLQPGATGTITVSPLAGVYPYWDPRNAPFNRLMGLYGVLVVLPGVGNTPYSNPTPNVQALFNALGVEEPFTPGTEGWIAVRPETVPPNPELPPDLEPFLYRTRLWVIQQVDSRWNARVEAGENAEPGGITPAEFIDGFVPDYFMINGKSGQFSSHDHATLLEGFIGEPHMVRIVNTGLQIASLHLHANHFYVTAVNNHVMENVAAIDTMTLPSHEADASDPTFGGGVDLAGGLFLSGGSRVDWLVPFIRPPDIPNDPTRQRPLREVIPNEFRFVLGGVPQSPLKYPMHDHMEPSQTTTGGNYPNGTLTDFIFLGDKDKVPFPKPVV
ncbi:MAG: hypothetical protein HY900_30270 [Deltaproteobacteria bacterium]|nr:hypothetical protein [Deltaproteobacteria bacterium]